MTKEELASRILDDLYQSSYNKDINLFNSILQTIDFYFQSELRSLKEQEYDLNEEHVLTLVEQAQVLGELQGKLQAEK